VEADRESKPEPEQLEADTAATETDNPPAEKLPDNDGSGAREKQCGKGICTSAEFERFWACYPRATGKGKAYEQWRRTLEDGAKPDSLIQAASAYAAECRTKKREIGHIKHPATFLGPGRHWIGYLRELDISSVDQNYAFTYEDLAALWDCCMPGVGFMPAPEPTRMWKKYLSERIDENPSQRNCLDWWLNRFREIDDSDFASGRSPGKNGVMWRLELYMLLESEEKLQKLANGVYRNRQTPDETPQFAIVADSETPEMGVIWDDYGRG
jgi:hypothetical protein